MNQEPWHFMGTNSAFSYKADNVLSIDSSFLSEVMIPLLQYIRQVLIRNYKLVSLLPTAHQQTLKEMRWKYPSWHCSMCASLKCPFGIGFHLIEMQTSPTWRCYYIFMRLAPLKCKTCARGPKLRQGPALVVFFFRWTSIFSNEALRKSTHSHFDPMLNMSYAERVSGDVDATTGALQQIVAGE